ncbi:hypothetical protein UA08_07666 [Talaromyces atroroseus]|uniref:Uncharacterized protein n=1 Tax=Talaromyces atroroseus TaxID=1441469 RepID=A0A225ARX6_TALAT|nr:hypothetical protein UA08_07666 [Talaromyces atroroseus]OKL57195.1 hypothetical protein UA08_07666 [Talaromyces atroroseus]
MCRFSFYELQLNSWDKAPIPLAQVNCKGDNLLVLATLAGCRPICGKLIQRNVDVNMQIGQYGSALAAAAAGGGEEHVKIKTGNYGSALAAAAQNGNLDTVKSLIEQGADVNLLLQTGLYGSALAAAAYWGQKEGAKSLMNAGAKLNLKLENGFHVSALHASQANIPWKIRNSFNGQEKRNEKELERDKLEVEELLRHAGAVDEEECYLV